VTLNKPRALEPGILGVDGQRPKVKIRTVDKSSIADHLRPAETANREADLSTEQIGAQTPTRFPRPHGNHGRPQGGGDTARARSQTIERLTPAAGRRVPMERLRRRADFLAAAGGRKIATAAFVLQALVRADNGPIRVGFTVSKKVGTAVERNRVRRRLKDVVKRSAAQAPRSGHDYVLIGRRAALKLPFERMIEEFKTALRRLEPRPMQD
jgi:ribonuclease P protein component